MYLTNPGQAFGYFAQSGGGYSNRINSLRTQTKYPGTGVAFNAG
jgi:hypothetical protein